MAETDRILTQAEIDSIDKTAIEGDIAPYLQRKIRQLKALGEL
jgi:hypothetical protein